MSTSSRKLTWLSEKTSQLRDGEAEADMETRMWKRRSADVAFSETNRELESQRLELYQAHQWADRA